ncbi:MAG: glutaredoxin domain-containing protein [Pseudomonadota bacterium]
MLFTFAGANGVFATVSKIDDVPQAQLGWVRVVDLSIKPAQRKDHELVYVADLRQKKKDGTFAYIVMSRSAFELAALGRTHQDALGPPQPATTGIKTNEIVLYATQWCPACKVAREYITKKGIPFVEKDIEKDPNAAAELMQKAQTAGISPNGVPVLDIKGTLVQGFDPSQFEALIGDKK